MRHVILFNLGGPDQKESVRPFLRNLFLDPAILRMPKLFRTLLAETLSRLRVKGYEALHYHSPLLEETYAQAQALEASGTVHVAMRYWHPFIEDIVKKIAEQNPTEIILLPLYPHFSTTTTGSAFCAFDKAWKKNGSPQTIIKRILSYPTHPFYIEALIDLIRPVYEKARLYGDPLILYSAHGLPLSIIDQGDPYEGEIFQTVQALRQIFETEDVICYQSRLGPKWLQPSTSSILKKCSQEKRPVVIVPISFVSEHIETLVELDIEYKKIAQDVPFYGRVPTLRTHPLFIKALLSMM